MHRELSLLVIGTSPHDLDAVAQTLDKHNGLRVESHILSDHSPYPIGTESAPDALVLAVGSEWRSTLPQLVEALPVEHPPFVIVGPDSDVEFLRTAMRAGARDAVTAPADPDEFLSNLVRVAEDERLRTGKHRSKVISVINSKGGSGATFLSSNLATSLATIQQGRTIVVDMDYQFGSLPTYLDLQVTNGLIKALEFSDSLDEAALQGYVQTHTCGLQMLAAAVTDIILPEDISEYRIKQLLRVLDGAYRFVVLDIPRRIDSSTAAALLQSDEILVVTQQTMAHLRDTKRLMFMLQTQLGVSSERIRLVINRYDRKSAVRLEDFSAVLLDILISTLPGDYQRVADSINLGFPLALSAPKSPLGRRVLQLATSVATGARSAPKSRGFFSRILPARAA